MKADLSVKPFFPLLIVLFFCLPAYSQNEIPERSSDQAEVIEKKIRKEGEEAFKKERRAPEVEEEPHEKPPTGPELRFRVREIRLEGNTVLPSKVFRSLISPYENKEVTMSELEELAQKIAERYKKQGFITSTAYVPEQRFEDGILRIRIVEGRVGNLVVEGNRFFRKWRTLSYTTLKTGEILAYHNLKKSLARMNRNPDRHVRSILKRGKTSDATDVVFKVKDQLPLHGSFSFDNHGVKTSGRERYGFMLRDNNLTTLDDMLVGGTVFGKDFGSVYAQYHMPIPQTDTTLIFGFSHAQVLPKRDLKPFAVNGKSQTYFGRIDQRIFETRYLTMSFDAGLEYKESRTKVLSGTFRRERLRVIRFGPTFREMDPWGFTDLRKEFSFGLDTLGAGIHADPANARLGVEPDFFKYQGIFQRNQKMPFETRAVLKAEFQIPSHKLSSSEALYLGGASSVRGYPEGDYLADTGFYVNFEYLVPSFFFPPDWKLMDAKIPLRKQIQFVFFADEGYGRLRGPSAREKKSRNLFGAGAGLRIQVYEQLFARIEWAYAFGMEPLGESDHSRFHFRLQYEI